MRCFLNFQRPLLKFVLLICLRLLFNDESSTSHGCAVSFDAFFPSAVPVCSARRSQDVGLLHVAPASGELCHCFSNKYFVGFCFKALFTMTFDEDLLKCR